MARRLIPLLLLAGMAWAGTPANSVEIQLPPGVDSAHFFARYVLAGQDFGGWVDARAGVRSYFIDTTVGQRPASEIRAILYAPGCAIQTLSAALAAGRSAFPFVCQPVRNVRIAGAIVRPGDFQGHQLTVQARYVLRWAASFLGVDLNMVTGIPVGDPIDVSADRPFAVSIPDLSSRGELEFQARERGTHDLLAWLVPDKPLPARADGGPVAFSLCAIRENWTVHDRYGFALRETTETAGDACARRF